VQLCQLFPLIYIRTVEVNWDSDYNYGAADVDDDDYNNGFDIFLHLLLNFHICPVQAPGR